MADKRVSVRIAAQGGKQVRAEFRGIAAEGRQSFALVGREVDQLNRRMSGLGRGSRNARFAMRNMGMQLNQVAQQGAVTGDYLRAMTIQLPDMLLGFGSLGVAIGIVAGVLGPFVVDLLSAADTSAKLSDSIDTLDTAVTDYAASVADAQAPTSDLIKKYGDLSGAARSLLAVQQDLARLNALDQIAAGMTAAREALGDIGTMTSSEFELVGDAVANVTSEIDQLRAEQRALASEGLDVGNNAARNIEVMARISELQNSLGMFGEITRPIYDLRDALGITTDDAVKLVSTMADLRDASNVEEQAAALERLRAGYVDALGGVENMTAEQRTLLGQLTTAALATIRFRSTMDDASVSVGGAAAQATTLADELSRAAGNAMSLVAQSLSAANESTIRLQYKDDPVGLAKALAGARFDAKVGDVSGADPILQEGLQRQREAYIANQAAVAQNQQALAAWNREQRKAAAGAGTLRQALDEQSTGFAAASSVLEGYVKESGDLGKEFGNSIVGAFRSAEAAIGNFVRTGKIDFSSLIRSMLADLAMLAARKYILGPIAEGVMGWLDGFGDVPVHHAGGIVGGPAPSRMMPVEAFANAPRLHSGGWPGLRGDEVPAILQRGERVLSRREVARGVGSGGVSRIEVSLTAGIEARIIERARGQAVQIVQEGLRNYDRFALPGRVEQISAMPGVTG